MKELNKLATRARSGRWEVCSLSVSFSVSFFLPAFFLLLPLFSLSPSQPHLHSCCGNKSMPEIKTGSS